MIIAATGHRPSKLGGYGKETFQNLTIFAENQLEVLSPKKVISGMALGWDQAIACAALDLEIPLVAAIPFKGQEAIWPSESQRRYNDILAMASSVRCISQGGYSPYKMHLRNQWMVNACGTILALWDGSSGGTKNCVDFAVLRGKKVINVWDDWLAFGEQKG
jgi:uncharacterized phage-like protein YoqJ